MIKKRLNKKSMKKTIKNSDETRKSIIKELKNHQIAALSRGILLPSPLCSEIASFIERNSIVEIKKRNMMDGICPHCCKAHIKNLAEAYSLAPKATEHLLSLFEGEIGHEGYYLDENTLCKVMPLIQNKFRNFAEEIKNEDCANPAFA